MWWHFLCIYIVYNTYLPHSHNSQPTACRFGVCRSSKYTQGRKDMCWTIYVDVWCVYGGGIGCWIKDDVKNIKKYYMRQLVIFILYYCRYVKKCIFIFLVIKQSHIHDGNAPRILYIYQRKVLEFKVTLLDHYLHNLFI